MTGRVAYILGLVGVLAAAQLAAQMEQVAEGYRPFGQAPKRVAFSWDMFAVDIDRCAVTWDPPLVIDGRSVARWRDPGTYLEWDAVMSNREAYEVVARVACLYRSQRPTTVTMTCASSDGTLKDERFDCPK
jgi:hypothetical protein